MSSAALGASAFLKAAKHRGAVGSPAQAAGEAEKAELDHRAQFQMAWISVRDPTNITTAPVSSSKFDFNIRLTIALQLLQRFSPHSRHFDSPPVTSGLPR